MDTYSDCQRRRVETSRNYGGLVDTARDQGRLIDPACDFKRPAHTAREQNLLLKTKRN